MSRRKRFWVSLSAAAKELGIKPKTALNAVSNGTFILPTYRLGRRRVVDRAVLSRLFELKRSEGLDILERYRRPSLKRKEGPSAVEEYARRR